MFLNLAQPYVDGLVYAVRFRVVQQDASTTHLYGTGWLASGAQPAGFMRSALPPGPLVSGGGSLAPRGDWRAPSDGSAGAWLRDLARFDGTGGWS